MNPRLSGETLLGIPASLPVQWLRRITRRSDRGPSPLYSSQERFGVIWSPKSSCTTVLLWFLHRLGHLEAAVTHGFWPHHYRAQVLMNDAVYRRGALTCDFETTPFLRVIRDPARRAVSSWSASFLIPQVDTAIRAFLGIDARAGYSFSDFIGFLEAGHMGLDIHLSPQRSRAESLVRHVTVTNLERAGLAQGLNGFEDAIGLERTDFGADTLLTRELARIAAAHHLKRFATSEDWSERPLTASGIDGRWPAYTALLTPATRRRLENLYAVDYECYREHLEPRG